MFALYNITAGFAVLAGSLAGFAFEHVGKIVLVGEAQVIGNGFDGMGGVLQQHFGKSNFSAQKIGMGCLLIMLLKFPDHFRTGNKQGVADIVNGNGGVDGLVQL